MREKRGQVHRRQSSKGDNCVKRNKQGDLRGINAFHCAMSAFAPEGTMVVDVLRTWLFPMTVPDWFTGSWHGRELVVAFGELRRTSGSSASLAMPVAHLQQ